MILIIIELLYLYDQEYNSSMIDHQFVNASNFHI